MEIVIEHAQPEHASIVPYLRAADVEEIHASTGLPAAAAVAYSIAVSKAYSVLLDERPVVIFGVGPNAPKNGRTDGRTGEIWLVGTEEIEKRPVMFYRVSKRLFPMVCDGYSDLVNFVDARNILSLRWLEWLGFDIGEAKSFGVYGLPFHFVRWRRI